MKIRFTPIASAISLAAGMLMASTVSADTIKIAIAGPFTGAVTQYGDMVKQGVDTAVEQINASGGVLGKQLEAVTIDDGCEPKQGPVVANRVINDGINYVVGHVCSGATIAATDIYNNEGIVMISPSATAPAVTEGKGYETIFRTIGRDDQQGPAAAKFIIEQVKPAKVAVLHDKQSYGQGIASSVKSELEAAGYTDIFFEGINAGDNDYSAVITKLKSSGADFVYYGGYHPEMGLLLRQGAEQGLTAKMMGPEGVGNPDISAIAGEAVEGMLLTLPADFTQDADNAAIVKAFADKGRDASGAFQLTAYAATQSLAAGIEGAGVDDPIKVAEYLHANEVKTPIGVLSWTEQGDLKDFQFDIFTWHADGSKSVYAQ
ncbi:branched-chain amino acid ABC transporter substrate-binding protein [Paenalcaligenes niemegkensis]|uniref:branched-chain amino acid ABC transporter substrate-binding protein n=1 Tax=Paenalcaligenes niemegkensis TaxID=2895469 RepID=UPI001EE98CDE|nr:branched-chain amino acid ABC transporter substrate-binding protein [Paenalcaligenes niemegkensis]MCQ9616337.1 branched-chain amino acid ABC transporter substrate-binding protein [Paenalcaligenes niemegkensis]